MPIYPKYVQATASAGDYLSADTGSLYKYRHIDGDNGGHTLTITLVSASAPNIANITIIVTSPTNPAYGLTLATITTDGVNPVSYSHTFNMTGHYDIDIFNGTDVILAVSLNS